MTHIQETNWRVKIMDNNIIDIKWCEDHAFKMQVVNVASSLTYYYDDNNCVIITYTKSTMGKKEISVYNHQLKSFITLEKSANDNITETDLKKLCDIVEINYPFS